MATIIAKGIKDGLQLEVICADIDGIRFLFNNLKDELREREIRRMMAERPLIAGTFSPDENSMLNVLNILQYLYFDKPPDIETAGEFETMPYEKGVVY